MNDVKKLPKWAQDQIEVLEMRLAEMTKRATAWEEKKVTRVSIPHLSLRADEKPKYLPDDRKIRFATGLADWEWIDAVLRKDKQSGETYLELMAGTDLWFTAQAPNVLKITVGR